MENGRQEPLLSLCIGRERYHLLLYTMVKRIPPTLFLFMLFPFRQRTNSRHCLHTHTYTVYTSLYHTSGASYLPQPAVATQLLSRWPYYVSKKKKEKKDTKTNKEQGGWPLYVAAATRSPASQPGPPATPRVCKEGFLEKKRKKEKCEASTLRRGEKGETQTQEERRRSEKKRSKKKKEVCV